MPFAPKSSFGRTVLGGDGIANKRLLTYIFIDMDIAIQFLMDLGLIRRQMRRNTCDWDKSWCVRLQSKDYFIWVCRRRPATVWNELKSIKHGSWFQHTSLTYDIVSREPAKRIYKEQMCSSHTISDWGQFWNENILLYVLEYSEKICGPDKIVEINGSKFGRRKYDRCHAVKGQCVFGGVERNSGRTFFVPVPDRSVKTMVAVIRDWFEPGTMIISDSWGRTTTSMIKITRISPSIGKLY